MKADEDDRVSCLADKLLWKLCSYPHFDPKFSHVYLHFVLDYMGNATVRARDHSILLSDTPSCDHFGLDQKEYPTKHLLIKHSLCVMLIAASFSASELILSLVEGLYQIMV